MSISIDCFKAYDVRGQIPNQLNADICYRIGNATAEFLSAKTVVVGRGSCRSCMPQTDFFSYGLRSRLCRRGQLIEPLIYTSGGPAGYADIMPAAGSTTTRYAAQYRAGNL